MTERDTLAQRQRDLVRALVAGGPVPPGFDPVAVAAAGEVCRHKRGCEGGDLVEHFARFGHMEQ
ncbi:hypothetical protein ACWDTP_25810 [Mycobacterium sp. NPDC003449]